MENEQKTTKIRWEGNRAYVGQLWVGSIAKMSETECRAYIHANGQPQIKRSSEAEARAWVERYLGNE